MGLPDLERYKVIGELGQGGMSIVYRARDKQLSRDVALKVLHDFLARQPEARRRLHREAVAVAKLKHPGILEIFDYSGPDAEQAYIVTELIEGTTLRDFAEKNGKPRLPELAVLLVAELVRALRHAHERGVIHRDLKPENIMITRLGQLKLMDFGIAQIMEGATRLTATGTLLGSPAHMAPEVIDGKTSDHRADIFSLGTILYWLAVGRLPFEAPNPSALFRQILEGRYDPPQLHEPRIGNGLARIIEKALHPDLELRYQDISELEFDLEEELHAVGLEPIAHLSQKFLRDPIGFADDFQPKLIDALLQEAREALAEKNVARTLDRTNRILAIEADHAEATQLQRRANRRDALLRGVQQVAIATAAILLLAGASYGAVRWSQTAAPPPPIVRTDPPPTIDTTIKTPTPGPETASLLGAVGSQRSPPPARPAKTEPVAAKRRVLAPRAKVVKAAAASREIPPIQAKKGRVSVRIKPGYGHVYVDGRKFTKNETSFVELELEAGRHQIIVKKPQDTTGIPGSHAPRTVEVTKAGDVYWVRGGARGGKVHESMGVEFAVPGNPKDYRPEDFPEWKSL